MAEKYNNFQSQTAINSQKEENRKARQIILEQAKKNYERAEARKAKAQKQGEGTWMLDSVSQRIIKEEKEMKKAKKKKRKKDKKEKKKRKKVSSDSSSSDNDSEDEKWIEPTSKTVSASDVSVKGPQLQRDSWMESPLDLIPTTTRQELRDAAKKQKDEMKRESERMLEPGQHTRELNPHWKEGGSGLPEEKPEKKSKSLSLPSSGAGDGGLSWLRKAYDRCKQQAQEEGRSLEEVAAERWGSLKKLETMLAEAEGQHRGRDGRGAGMDRGRGDRSSRGNWDGTGIDRSRGDRRHDDRSEERNRDRERDRRRGSSEERDDRRRNRSRDRERGYRDRDSDRDRGGERRDSRERQRESRSGGRNGFQRPGSDSDGETWPARSRFMKPGDDSADSERGNRTDKDTSRNRFIKPLDDGNETANRSRFLKPSDSEERRYADKRDDSSSRRFIKPGDDRNDKPQDRERHRRRSRTPESSQPRWKKKPVVESQKASGREDEREGKKERVQEKSRERRRSRSSSSDSSSSSSDSGSDASDSDKQTEEAAPPPKILTEEELNDMAAKILRAEIMGDDDMVADLKSKLEQARKAREAAKSESGASAPDFCHRRGTEERKRERGKKRRDDEEEEKDNVVVLSRTSKGGLVRPVLGSLDDSGYGGGKRRKKNVVTHDNRGERTKYFDDDDKFDLKTLVEQEKAGTAEDQNSMFARLAGRSTDRDLDMDDMFVSKAAKKQDDEKMATKDRAAAIFEHKKINAAMEKCHRCFDKVPKHLIVAIGTKSYLCLPHHRSLTDGHCLIVPMQHVSAATGMDEDVWQEMQLFRKCLVRMFSAQDQDVVVMETVMHVKHFPHTAIECVPLDKEVGDLAPIYFKKAIQEAGPEWSDNKKLHSLRDKDVRHVIPKGFPYFSVDFGLEGGFATVIEDEATFPPYFGREIVGGMIDAEPTLWRKPHKQSFEDQRQKVLQFEKWWRPYDWTQDLGAGD